MSSSKEYNRQYQRAHRALYAKAAKKWRDKNRAFVNAQAKARYWKDPERHRKTAQRYRERHPDRIKIMRKLCGLTRRVNGKTSEYRFKRREWYRKYKSETPCVDCGRCFPAECMDFDHVGNKTKQVSHLVTGGYSIGVILKEIEQCDLVCSNCHRIRTCARKRRV